MKHMAAVFSILLAFQVTSFATDCATRAKVVLPVMSEDIRKVYEAKLAEANGAAAIEPENVEALIWQGRRIGYLGGYSDAIKLFSAGIIKFPNDARLYRHRGHRYITIRCFDDAIKDFEAAAKLIKGRPDEVEPDGLPNVKNIPTGTLQSNIWYHLGLAYYLKGDFKNALRAYRECQKVSRNNDMQVATSYWHYMTLRRLGNAKEAKRILEPFKGDIELIENTEYLKLIRLNRGEVGPDALLSEIGGDAKTLGSSSLGYGIGNYFLYNGGKEKAAAVFKKIVDGDQWASFGYIAAESDLKRL